MSSILVTGAFPGEIDSIPNATALGVGSIAAGISTTKLLLQNHDVQLFLFLGSAGILQEDSHLLSTGDIVTCRYCSYFSISQMEDKVKIPEIQKRTVTLASPIPKLAEAHVISTEGVSLQNLDKQTIQMQTGSFHAGIPNSLPILENLEVFGVASAIASVRPKLHVIFLLGITNVVSENGSNEWKKNWRAVSHKVQKLATELVSEFQT